MRPFGGVRSERVQNRRPPALLPLMRFAALQSVDMRRARRVYWIPCSRLALAVSGGTCGFSLHAVPRDLAIPGSSSRELTAPSESSASYPPRASRPRAPPMGFALPSSRRQLQASSQRVSNPAIRPSSAFLTPPTVCPPTALRVYFTPLPRPGFSLQRFVPPAQPYRLVTGLSCPLVVGTARLPAVAHRLHLTAPRPQGFAPCGNPRPAPQFYPLRLPVPSPGISSSRFSLSGPLRNE